MVAPLSRAPPPGSHKDIQMAATHPQIILASASETRARLLRNAGLVVNVAPARIDEEALRASHQADGGTPRDLADLLAEMKSLKLSRLEPEALVLGCDQILECGGRIFAKPETPACAIEHLGSLSGKPHRLFSAAVVSHEGVAIWRHVGQVRMTMHPLSRDFIADYVMRNWDTIRHCVGCYRIEDEGVRLFARIEGDFFHILGLPLIELLTWLRLRGDIGT